ncbi:MAG TPA: NTF2 fold immunity protein [Terriglobales bacterium]|nr:NTF2 fold immunity protein [Terriglobales bacterium]
MKTIILVLAMAVTLATGAQQPTPAVRVPDAVTAVSIAEKALGKIYGKHKINAERPFRAMLSGGVWHVAGTLYCKDEHGKIITDRCVGGVAMADIRQSDGKVLRTGHTQ